MVSPTDLWKHANYFWLIPLQLAADWSIHKLPLCTTNGHKQWLQCIQAATAAATAAATSTQWTDRWISNSMNINRIVQTLNYMKCSSSKSNLLWHIVTSGISFRSIYSSKPVKNTMGRTNFLITRKRTGDSDDSQQLNSERLNPDSSTHQRGDEGQASFQRAVFA